jgi:hypothetical protein
MRNDKLAILIKERLHNHNSLTTSELADIINECIPSIAPNTISWKIYQLKKENYIQQIGRGHYSFQFKPEYSPELSLKTRRAYNKLKPFCKSDLCAWDTMMLDTILEKESQNNWMFFATNKDEIENVFEQSLDFSKKIFLAPDKEIITRYILPLEEAIILTPLISETPMVTVGDFLTLSIEGLLVNAWLNSEYFLEPAGYNIEDIFKAAFSKYNVNKNKLLRFAARRDKRDEIGRLIKNITP